MRYLVTSLILAGCLSGCGFKGPLYLPQTTAPAASQPANASVRTNKDASQPTTSSVQLHKDASQP
jgi:predicted small lipoprotein YifL